MLSFDVRNEFTADEKLIVSAGVDRFTRIGIGGKLTSLDGFAFEGSKPKINSYRSQQNVGTYSYSNTFEKRVRFTA